MSFFESRYDVAIVGGGHNGLVAACYLAKAGLSVLVLERNPELGGATRSPYAFEGFAAKLSVYSYLVSLFPQKIVDDLGLYLKLKSRRDIPHALKRRSDSKRNHLFKYIRDGKDMIGVIKQE